MRKWFDEILAGTKKFEYREIKPYWTRRLFVNGKVRDYDVIYFRNGYARDCLKMKVEFKGVEFGEFGGKKVYAIKLGDVVWSGR